MNLKLTLIRYLRALAVVLTALFGGILLWLTWFSYQTADGYVHPGHCPPPADDLLVREDIQFQEIELVTKDGLTLAAWYTPPENGALILLAHGYGDARSQDFYILFARHGYGVLAWDFRGHGQSEGDLVTLGYFETLDVEAALEYALAQPGVEHIGAWGGSMGAATVLRTAAFREEIEAVAADSSFASLEAQMDHQAPYPVLNPMIRFFAEQQTGLRLELVSPVQDIARISPRPVFIIQGMQDTVIPLDSAEKLYKAAGEPRQVWTEPDVGHLNMYAGYRTRYTRRVIKFFNQALLGIQSYQ
ncbi:MAG: alpha/beta fold hydrolase [Anaerolineales bacterium]|nr:alpha/beta fold hydrolase [Anaerolineales bacterium]